MGYKKLYDIAITTSEYESKNGEKKKRWKNIGSIFEGENSTFMVMDAFFNPAAIQRDPGKDSIVLGLYKPKDSENNSDITSKKKHDPHSFYDEIPF